MPVSNCIPPPDWEAPPGVRGWTPNRYANMIFGEILIAEEDRFRFPNLEFPPGIEPGYLYPCTLHPVRAIAEDNPLDFDPIGMPFFQGHWTAHPEACRLHVGAWIGRFDGVIDTLEVAHKCMPRDGDDELRQLAIGRPFVAPFRGSWHVTVSDAVIEPLAAGCEYDLSAYETPETFEAFLASGRVICEQPI